MRRAQSLNRRQANCKDFPNDNPQLDQQFWQSCIPLDVPAYGVKVIVILNWEALESALINMPLTNRSMVGMVSLSVR